VGQGEDQQSVLVCLVQLQPQPVMQNFPSPVKADMHLWHHHWGCLDHAEGMTLMLRLTLMTIHFVWLSLDQLG